MPNLKYYAFYKPYGILSQFTSDNPSITLSNFNLPKDIYASGRLDKDSEGLLLLTNDGPFIHQMANPKFDKIKTYLVQVEKIPTIDALELFANGLKIEDYVTKKCSVKILNEDPKMPPRVPPIRTRLTVPTCWLEVKMSEGKNRQIRKMTAAIGHPTLRLIRIKIGNLGLGQLLPGEFREVLKTDIT
jgi:23S rRNA pseudouridine2457 synthase